MQTFVFGTRLTNVTRQLRMKDPDVALAGCSDAVKDWSGGTRIASNLRAFNRDWSRRVLGQGATVLLITDGLEREDKGESGVDLEAEMDRLHRSCRRLIWLNPLLRYEGFAARARGVRLMLPHVDEFRPVHSLEAIGDLVKALGDSGGGRRRSPPLARRGVRAGEGAARRPASFEASPRVAPQDEERGLMASSLPLTVSLMASSLFPHGEARGEAEPRTTHSSWPEMQSPSGSLGLRTR